MLEEGDPYAFYLAERLGMTVREMSDRMGMDEYLEWMAFDQWRNAQQKLAEEKAKRETRLGRRDNSHPGTA